MNRKLRVASTILAAVIVVGGGISAFAFHNKSSVPTAPAQVTTKPGKTQLISLSTRERTLSAHQATPYHAIPVVTQSGKHTTIDVSKHPVVFLTDWDSAILNQFVGQKFTSKPTFVVTWPQPKQTLQQDLKQVVQDAKQLHLTDPVVALDASNPKAWLTGIPDTYVQKKQHVVEIPGILAANQVKQWAQIF